MASSGINLFTSTTSRITGLSSGMDTDQIISDLMKTERLPLDKLTQQKQLAEWRTDAYRNIASLLQTFQTDFFDILKPASNMRSESIYQKFTSKSSDESVVKATGGESLSVFSHKIVVDRIATAAKVKASGTATKPLSGNTVGTFEINSLNNSFTLSFNGVNKVITLPEGTYTNAADIIGNGSDGKLKQLVSQAFSGVSVSADADGKIVFTSANNSDTITLSTNLIQDNFLEDLKIQLNAPISFPLNIVSGRKLNISFTDNGESNSGFIEWTSAKSYNNIDELVTDIQTKIDNKFGAGKITVGRSSGKLTFEGGQRIESIALSNSYKNTEVLSRLGFTSGDSNKLALSDTLEKVSKKLKSIDGLDPLTFAPDGSLKLTINGKVITASKNDTFSNLLTKINNSEAGVTVTYSQYSDEFAITSKGTGEANITLNDNGSNFFANAKLTVFENGVDASFTIDGEAGTRATNTFTIDGVNYTLLKAAPGVENTVELTRDVDATFNSIKSFVDKYNELLDKINTAISEKYDRDYQPLTSEQKSEMSEEDIKKWEEKAKTGLLKNDSILNKIVFDMRRALSDSIQGVSGGLTSLGITTGTYEEKGKLEIDEAKLKEAIKNSPDQVMQIFAQESTTDYSRDATADAKSTRYKENGIINRIYDILQDNITTRRDINGYKGILLQKAGIVGDASEFNNFFYNEIQDYNKRISDLTDKLIDKENNYYKKFAAMEAALSKMNSQSSWLASQFSGSGS